MREFFRRLIARFECSESLKKHSNNMWICIGYGITCIAMNEVIAPLTTVYYANGDNTNFGGIAFSLECVLFAVYVGWVFHGKKFVNSIRASAKRSERERMD